MSCAEPVPGVHGDIDAAYEAKYDRYGPEIVGTVVGRKAEEVTIRLMPRSSERSDDSVGGGGPGVLMKRLAHNRRSGAEATLLARIDCGSRVLRAVDVHVA